MAKKTWIYSIITVVVIVAGYLNYFGEEQKLDTLKKVIETTDAVYRSGEYLVEAKKQIDYVDDKESKFEIAKATIKGMTLQGDNVWLDKVKNLILKNNVVGTSSNGWKFETSELRYHKDSDRIITEAGVLAVNEKKGIHLEGKKFITSTSMQEIILQDGIRLEIKQIGLTGDKAQYLDETKQITLTGDVHLYNPDPKGKQFQGTFGNIIYNTENGMGETSLPFTVNYEGISLEAKHLLFHPEKFSFSATKDVLIQNDEYRATLNAVEKKEGEEKIHFVGPVVGNGEEYEYSMATAEYDSVKKEMLLQGNIKILSKKGEKILADKAIYREKEKVLDIYGEDNNAIYEGNGHRIEGKAFHYDIKTGNISTNTEYRYTNEKGDIFEGKNFLYEKETEQATILGEVSYQTKEYHVVTKDLEFSKGTGILSMQNPYQLTMKDGRVFKGEQATYNQTTGEFISAGNVSMLDQDQILYGHDIKYNTKTGKGSMEGPVNMIDKIKNINLTGQRIIFDKEKGGELIGNISGNLQGTKVKTNTAIYQKENEKIVFPNSLSFDNQEQNIKGNMKNGEYLLEERKFIGNQAKAFRLEEELEANFMEYQTEMKEVWLKGNVKIINPDQTIRTEQAKYVLETRIVEISEIFEIERDVYRSTGREALIDLKSKNLQAKKPVLTSQTGDFFQAEMLEGNLDTMVFDFTKDVYGKTIQKGVLTEYKGQKARLHLAKNIQGSYEMKKIEMLQEPIFIQEDKKLIGKYGEYEFSKQLATFTGDVVFTSQEGKISADKVVYNTQTKKGKASGNVQMNYDDGKKE